MPYDHIEQIRDRRGEKVAFFLTAENLGGMIAIGLPVYVGTVFIEQGWLRGVLIIVSALIGYLLTVEVGGLRVYERMMWRARGIIRMLFGGRIVRIDQVSGRTVTTRGRPYSVNAPFRVRTTARSSAPQERQKRRDKKRRPVTASTPAASSDAIDPAEQEPVQHEEDLVTT